MTSAGRVRRERVRLIKDSERLRRKWHHANVQRARVADRLAELAAELKAAAAGLDALDAAEDREPAP